MHEGNHPETSSLKCNAEGKTAGKPKPVKYMFRSFTKQICSQKKKSEVTNEICQYNDIK